jgi:uncharacterized protein YdaU (DUF1376 family)
VSKSPAFQFYPKDFLSDFNVTEMDWAERGVYITLLCHCWLEGGIPKESKMADNLIEDSPRVKACFYEEGGMYRHRRLDDERAKQAKYSESQRINSAKRWDSHGNPTAIPRDSSASASSSSSPEIPPIVPPRGTRKGRKYWESRVGSQEYMDHMKGKGS